MSEHQTVLVERTIRDKALEVKDEICLLVMEGLREALKHPDLKLRQNAIRSAAPYVAMIQGDSHLEARLRQSSEQHFQTLAAHNEQFADRMKRLDANKPTDIVGYLSLEEREARRDSLIRSLRSRPTPDLTMLKDAAD